jgi:hypothetical protein
MKTKKTEHLEFGLLAAVGVVVVAVGVDFTGRLLHWLYGEWPYICAGLVVLLFIFVSAYVHSEFSNTHWRLQKEVESKFAEYELRLSNGKYERRLMKDDVEFLRRSFQEHWRLCEKTIKQVDKLLEQKAPIVTAAPQPVQAVEPRLHDAVQEVVGGAV